MEPDRDQKMLLKTARQVKNCKDWEMQDKFKNCKDKCHFQLQRDTEKQIHLQKSANPLDAIYTTVLQEQDPLSNDTDSTAESRR